jgi:hypothetical protein
MGIDNVVWDVDGIKNEYTGKVGRSQTGFSIAQIEKSAD